MKPKKLILLILLFAIIGIAVTITSYFFFVIDTIRIIPMDVEFSPSYFGISGDTDALHFGRVALINDAFATKFINITNDKNHASVVSITFSGEMAPWTEVKENNFILEPGEDKKLEFNVIPPENAVPGNYTGKAKIVIKRMWN